MSDDETIPNLPVRVGGILISAPPPVPLPGGREEAGPPNPYNMPVVGFVNFNPDGSIRFAGRQAPGFTQDAISEDAYVCFGDPRPLVPGIGFIDYVDHDGDDWVVVPRPELDADFDTLELEPYEEASIPDLPAAQVSFSGPVSGEIEHPGGPFEIGWTIPGTYTVTINVWPHMPAVHTFTVA